jgi:formylglycine-generating enzyme required for sulfatase activity
LAGNVLILDGTVLDVGSHRVTVGVSDSQQLFGQRIFSVEVLPRITQPLQLATPRLAPCFAGLPYQFKLEAYGGVPPLEWEIAHLPEGLSCDFFYGTISGVFPRDMARQYEQLIRITVTDQTGAQVAQDARLTVIDRDHYCEVPAGSFPIGHHETPARTHELNRLGLREQVERRSASGFPPGEVYLPRFFIKRYPVTNRDWKRFVDAKEYPAQPPRWAAQDFDWKKEGDLPVTDIAYKDMLAYCAWRGSRLPSGWEWEKAARGPTGKLFPWGDEFDANLCNGPEMNWGALTPVDQFPEGASACGALDLAGNAWECVRQFQEAYGQWRPVLRGGSFADEAVDLLPCAGRLAAREWHCQMEEGAVCLKPAAPATDPHIGFRDVIEVEDAPAFPQGLVPLIASHFLLPGTRTEVSTPPVFLARYAVSNEEYCEFVRAADRSRPPHWRQQEDEMFPFADRYLPVTNVSFSDAEAFCRWKSGRLGVECQLMTLRVWRAAVHGPGLQAQGFVPRSFPWGDQDVPFRRNGRDLGWGGPMRVFELTEGRGACGAYHLVGNVAQWISPTQAVGGSWLRDCRNSAEWVESIDPEETRRRGDLGFRYYCSQLPGENPAAAM